MASSLAVIAAFLALWLAPTLWVVKAADRQRQWQRTGAALGVCALLFLIGAWAWHIPLNVQQAVTVATASPGQIALPELSCAELDQSLPVLEQVSQGKISVSRRGEIQVPAELWGELPREQQNTLLALAEQARVCAGLSRDGVTVRNSSAAAAR